MKWLVCVKQLALMPQQIKEIVGGKSVTRSLPEFHVDMRMKDLFILEAG